MFAFLKCQAEPLHEFSANVAKYRFLGGKIEIKSALRHPGPSDDIRYPGLLVTLLMENFSGGFHQYLFFPAFILILNYD